jgi:phage terminase small subunit
MPAVRKPDNVHKLRGTFRKDRHGDPETKLEMPQRAPTMPKVVGMDKEAKAEWRRVTRALSNMGVLTVLDRAIVAQYCLLWGRLCRNPDSFDAALFAQLRMAEQELGFTPPSRGKITVPKKDGGLYSKFTK